MAKNINLGDVSTEQEETRPVKAKGAITLTMEEMKVLEAEAIAEFEEEAKAELMEEFKAKTKAALRKKIKFKDEEAISDVYETVTVELAKHADRITIDGVVYLHGLTYKVSHAKACAMRDIMYRTWLHQTEIDGQDMNDFMGRRKYQSTLSPGK